VWDTAQRRLYRLRDTVTTLGTGDRVFVVSDLLLVTEITPPEGDDITSRRDLPVSPLYGATVPKGKPLGIVWETYRLDSLPEGRRRYQVNIEVQNASRQPILARMLRSMSGGERRGTRIEFESSRPMAEGRTVEWVEVSSDLPIGNYRLVFTITDGETGVAVTREREFRVR
jgi:hypothetical protein